MNILGCVEMWKCEFSPPCLLSTSPWRSVSSDPPAPTTSHDVIPRFSSFAGQFDCPLHFF